MKEKRKIYYLTNAEFDVQISKGMIISMKQTGDSYQTQYADEKLGFGGICILYEDVHKNIVEFFANDQETYQESGVVVGITVCPIRQNHPTVQFLFQSLMS